MKTATQIEYAGSGTPILGLNKLINPKTNDKFSKNLYLYLTFKRKLYTNIFFDPETHIYYIGLKFENNSFFGSKLLEVFCTGNNAKTWAWEKKACEWKDVTELFWEKYIEIGKEIYHPDWKINLEVS